MGMMENGMADIPENEKSGVGASPASELPRQKLDPRTGTISPKAMRSAEDLL